MLGRNYYKFDELIRLPAGKSTKTRMFCILPE